jgi:hypothetical protein
VANIKSQIKRNRTNEVARIRNKAAKSEIKTRLKTAVAAAESGAETAADDCGWPSSASTRRPPAGSSTRTRLRIARPAWCGVSTPSPAPTPRSPIRLHLATGR